MSTVLEKDTDALGADIKESTKGFCRRGKQRSLQVEGPKTENAREPNAESLVRRMWRLRISEAAEDSNGEKTEQCA